MRKRILSAILAIVMVLSVLPNGVFATAATDIVAAAGNVEAPLVENSTVSVPVVFTENSGVAQIMIQAAWDDSALELTSVTFGALPDAGSAPISEIEDGTYLVYAGDWQMTEDYVGINEPVFTLNFKILSGAQAKTYDITLSALENREALDANMQAKMVGFTNGTVKLVKPANSHLQWVEDESELYSDTNLWTLLEPKKEYHTGTKWRYDHATVYSVTIPVKEGDKIYANSFQAKPANEGTSSGIAVAFFYNGELVSSLLPAQCYAEYNENGFITVPEGVNEVCIPVWKNNANAVVNLKSLPQRVDAAELTVTAPVTGETPVTEVSGESYTGTISWNGDPDKFAAETVYTATITLTANEGYKFPANATATVNGAAATAQRDADGKLVVTYTFPATEKNEIGSAELTITAPKAQAVPETTLSGADFTGAITWSPVVDGTFADDTVYTATVVLTTEEGCQFADDFAATINGEAVEFTVNADGTATGSIAFAATGEPVNSHLQWVDDESELYADTNLWTLLEPENGYYAAAGWLNKYSSITIPVEEGDKIYASSFQSKDLNFSPSNRNGIVVAFLYGEEIVDFRSYTAIYAEYKEKGFVEVPAGVNAVNIPMWVNNDSSVVNLLTLPVRISSAELAVAAPVTGEIPVTEVSGENYTGTISWSGNPDKFAAETVYTATVTLTAKEGCKFPADFTATINGEAVEFTVNDDGIVTGSITFAATEEPLNSHLQWVEDDSELYSDTNLWPLLEPKHEYHTGTIWRENYKDIWSVTIPVKEGDQIYASSFQSRTITGGTSNGIAVAFFYNEDVVSSLAPTETYAEYTENGYITIPAGVNAVCIPVWKNDENAVVKLLTLPDRPSDVLVGDVNDDGSVTPKDAMILIRYVNNWPGAGVVSMSAADINKDGAVTPKDAMILIRYVNNWPGYDDYFVSK